MTSVNDFLGSFKELIRITFAHEAIGLSAYQAAKSFNLQKAVDGIYPDQFINPAKAVLSTGSLPLPDSVTMNRIDNGILFNWDQSSQINASVLDTLVAIARVQQRGFVKHRLIGTQRSDRSYFWPTDLLNYGTIDVWIAFRNFR